MIVNRKRHSKHVPAKVKVKWLSVSLEKAKRNVSLLRVFVFRVIHFFLCVVGRKGRIVNTCHFLKQSFSLLV